MSVLKYVWKQNIDECFLGQQKVESKAKGEVIVSTVTPERRTALIPREQAWYNICKAPLSKMH